MPLKLKQKVKTSLDEARMLVLGCQVLIGFQFQAIYQDGFARFEAPLRIAHAAGLALMILALALLITPSTFHVLAEDQKPTRQISDIVTRLTGCALPLMAAGLGLNLMVVTASVVGFCGGVAIGTGFILLALGFWCAWALGARRWTGLTERRMASERKDEPGDLTDQIDHMLTEARTILPGAQALMGFQLIAVLTRSFEQLPGVSKLLHLAALGLVAMSIILLMTPAAYHRIVYAGENSAGFLTIGNRLTVAATVPLGLGLAIDFAIACERTLASRSGAVAAGILALLVLAGLWYAYPLVERWRQKPS